MSELLGLSDDPEMIMNFPVKAGELAGLLKLIDDGTINGKTAKSVFRDMIETGKKPEIIIEEKGLTQVSDTSEIETIIDKVLASNQQSVDDFRNGKEKAMGFLVGQVMKESKGKANPQMVNEILIKKLKS